MNRSVTVREVRRSRSSLEGLIVAWIAVRVVSSFLGAGLYAIDLSSKARGYSVSPAVVQAFGFMSLALGVAIVVVLLARDEIAIAVCVIAAALVLPLVLGDHSVQSAERELTKRVAGVAGAPRTAEAQKAAVGERVSEVYALAPRALGRAPAHGSTAGEDACARTLTTAARAQLVEAFRADDRGSCGAALTHALGSGALGSPQTQVAGITYSITLSQSRGTAVYEADNGVFFEFVSAGGRWLIDRFAGGRLSRG